MNKTETKLFKDLLALPTAPYYEGAVDAYIRAFAKKRNLSVKTDKYGNLIVRYTNGKKPKPVALAGHMDHPGLEVLEANGRDLTARWLGGCDPKHFPGGRVILYSGGEEISGKANSTLSPEKIFSIRAARSLPETEGVFGHWQLKPVVFNGDLIHTKGADNLASCAAILATLDRLRRKKTNADLWGV
ncbi:MAG: hypothetical protein O2954_19305, partial [bacterium]|nr:hypothetical protein [bacterium]